jgi:hypothetical protein
MEESLSVKKPLLTPLITALFHAVLCRFSLRNNKRNDPTYSWWLNVAIESEIKQDEHVKCFLSVKSAVGNPAIKYFKIVASNNQYGKFGEDEGLYFRVSNSEAQFPCTIRVMLECWKVASCRKNFGE